MESYSYIVFFGIIALACGFSDEHMEMINKMSMGCVEKTGVSQDLVAKAKSGVFEADAKLSEYTFCMFNSPGFMSDAGDYQIDTMKTLIGEQIGADVASKMVDACTGFQGDKLEKAVQMAKCMFDKSSGL